MRPRLLLLALAFVVAFGALGTRLAWVQLADAETRREAAAGRLELTPAPRGSILDRAGRVLAEDVPAYRLVAIPADLDPRATLPGKIAQILHVPEASVEARWRRAARETAALLRAGARALEAAPPVAIAEAPSPASVAAFKRLAAAWDGLSVDGARLLAAPALLHQRDVALARLGHLTGLDPATLRARVIAGVARAMRRENALDRARDLAQPIPLAGDVAFEVAAEVEEEARAYPGIVAQTLAVRRYPFGAAAAHVIGSVGAPQPRTVTAFGIAGRVEDRVGVDGVEAARNLALTGTPGARLVEWNRRTRALEVLESEPAVRGADARLTIDIRLQKAVEAALDDAVARYAGKGGLADDGTRIPPGGGAAVILDARTGEVLALASSPRPDLARLRLDYADLLAREPSPLLHRAIAAELPPGSIMKPLTAAAARESLVITADSRIHCAGALNPRDRRHFKCDGVHGDIDLTGALAFSCNVFFYTCGQMMGEAPLTSWARAFGFGARSGIELPGERPGLVPSTGWKRARYAAQVKRVARGEEAVRAAGDDLAAALAGAGGPGGEAVAAALAGRLAERGAALEQARAYLERCAGDRAWTAGDDRNTAIGQGNLAVTPLQAARLGAAIASRGKLFRPRILLTPRARDGGLGPQASGLRAEDPEASSDDAETDASESQPRGPRPEASEQEEAVEQAETEVPDEEQMAVAPATWEAIRAGMLECVRVGTARSSGLAAFHAAAKTGTAEAPGKTAHAWVMGFAPADAPEVAFAVVIESVADHVHGGEAAGPAAAQMLRAYFGKR